MLERPTVVLHYCIRLGFVLLAAATLSKLSGRGNKAVPIQSQPEIFHHSRNMVGAQLSHEMGKVGNKNFLESLNHELVGVTANLSPYSSSLTVKQRTTFFPNGIQTATESFRGPDTGRNCPPFVQIPMTSNPLTLCVRHRVVVLAIRKRRRK